MDSTAGKNETENESRRNSLEKTAKIEIGARGHVGRRRVDRRRIVDDVRRIRQKKEWQTFARSDKYEDIFCFYFKGKYTRTIGKHNTKLR